ncbi:MAG TPA: class I SAM-dependent methyltransferase [Anaerolineaceae bacterium]|nr:class I SAM-dependent methyltransferase [Anaerolineaceae bacterium]
MTNLFPPSEFNEWAASYDSSATTDAGFPFDGYSQILHQILVLSNPRAGDSVLDLGIGTGNLALLFAARGCPIWGIDFSTEMLALARGKLPEAKLACQDLRADWPPAFDRCYDHIISAYTFHHFHLDEKVSLIMRLLEKHLQPGGSLVIGDIAFRNAAEEAQMRQSLGEDWEQEYYWLADESLMVLTAAGINASYMQISSCAGILHLKHE